MVRLLADREVSEREAVVYVDGKARQSFRRSTTAQTTDWVDDFSQKLGRSLITSGWQGSVNCMVEELHRRLGVKFAFLGELCGSDWDKVRTVALVTPEGVVDNFEYQLGGTPCSDVLDKDTCVFSERVAALFPEDELLVEMGVESYIGVPVHGEAGRPLGLLVLLDEVPLSSERIDQCLSALFFFERLAREALEARRMRGDLAVVGSELRRLPDEAPLDHVALALSHSLNTRGVFVASCSESAPNGWVGRALVWDGALQSAGVIALTAHLKEQLSEVQYGQAVILRSGFDKSAGNWPAEQGDVWLAIPLRSASGTLIGVLGALHDRTLNERICELPVVRAFGARGSFELEKQLRVEDRERQAQRFLELERMESLGLMAGGVAHDFNNIMVSVLGNAQVLLAGAEQRQDDFAGECLRDIQDAALSANQLCEQLMAYAGGHEIAFQQTDLASEMSAVLRLCRLSTGGARIVEQFQDEGSVVVNADPVQIGQLVMNLVSNAKDATGDDGTVIVSLTQELVESGNIVVCSHGDLKSGGYAVVSVQDDGVGMSERVASRIFDPFFTTKSDGHGLGLAGVIATVKGHGGVIDVRSARGVGTTIRVYLPLEGPPVSAQLPVGEDARSAETPIASTPSEDEQGARSISQA